MALLTTYQPFYNTNTLQKSPMGREPQRINMEDYFVPGFKTKPAVHIGSQSMRLYRGDKLEQAIEGMHLAAATEGDVAVIRDVNPLYIDYWKKLMGNVKVINLKNGSQREYLSNRILRDPEIIKTIQKEMHPDSSLMVYFPTKLEKQVADKLGVKLHGMPSVSSTFGTKTGIRLLANEAGIPMPEGFVCVNTVSVKKAMATLFEKYDSVIVKHKLSSAGRWMKRIFKGDKVNVRSLLNDLSSGKFVEGKDAFVVEAWIKSKASLCAQIEILENADPMVSAAWQQVIDSDGITYKGAIPLSLSPKAMKSFVTELTKLAWALKNKGAIGSYGPDFLVASEESIYPTDEVMLLELNARVPVTAFSLEIIKHIKGTIGSGFLTKNVKLNKSITFSELKDRLVREKLLITQKGAESGIVPYNIKLLNWNSLYYVSMADNWEEAYSISERVNKILDAK